MLNLYRKQTVTVGLDIGTSMVKAVKMLKRGKKYLLESFAVEPIEEGVIQSGEIKNPSSLAQVARNAVDKCGTNIRDVVVALPNFAILSDVLTMDLIPEKGMHKAVMVEAERISPFDMSEVEIDYEVLERNEETKKMKVLMVAVKQDIILSYIDVLSEAGLRPIILDVDLFALTNIFHINYDLEKYKSCILLDIGTESTIAAFLQNGIYHSARDISIAGENFMKELQLLPDMSSEIIHNILKGEIDTKLDPEPIAQALNRSGKEFANAVGVAVSYFQTSDNVEKLDMIVLTGGYALIPGLINILELRTGAEVVVMDPFINIEFDEKLLINQDPKKFSTILSVAMGLATRT